MNKYARILLKIKIKHTGIEYNMKLSSRVTRFLIPRSERDGFFPLAQSVSFFSLFSLS